MEWRVLKWPDAPFLCRIEEERVGRVRGEKPAPVMSGLMMSRPDMLFVDHWSRSGEVSGAAARAPAPSAERRAPLGVTDKYENLVLAMLIDPSFGKKKSSSSSLLREPPSGAPAASRLI